MKKTRLLLVVAMVFAALSFGFKAKAQATIPVRLSSLSGTYSNWTTATMVYVTLHNNTTNEDFNFYTRSMDMESNGIYDLGHVTEGTYTLTVSYYNANVFWDPFDFLANGEEGYNLHMYSSTDYTLSNNIPVSTDLGELFIVLYAY
ncbi:hypothetical protein KXQ82_17110 [Mucilaginibacter sp. HMF5004]|uniref:hypothetical protein n=1 Tax=Mucilaginibacter rivuli TaxID=2857527 RepID=UPI001C5E7E2E|nr:hypothetical protein [Mucilaginibacter rivuli]MBW4891450.1 hypothetical protein [Mucilaginibacter rivuli]